MEKNSATFDGPRYELQRTNYYKQRIVWRIINTSYNFGFNKISWKNLFIKVQIMIFWLTPAIMIYFPYRKHCLRFVFPYFTFHTMLGEHVIPEFNNSTINWSASYCNSKRNEPDARQYVYARDISEPNDPMRFLLDQSWSTRFYGDLNDKIYSTNLDLTIKPFAEKSLPSFKLGFMLDKKGRDFDAKFSA